MKPRAPIFFQVSGVAPRILPSSAAGDPAAAAGGVGRRMGRCGMPTGAGAGRASWGAAGEGARDGRGAAAGARGGAAGGLRGRARGRRFENTLSSLCLTPLLTPEAGAAPARRLAARRGCRAPPGWARRAGAGPRGAWTAWRAERGGAGRGRGARVWERRAARRASCSARALAHTAPRASPRHAPRPSIARVPPAATRARSGASGRRAATFASHAARNSDG